MNRALGPSNSDILYYSLNICSKVTIYNSVYEAKINGGGFSIHLGYVYLYITCVIICVIMILSCFMCDDEFYYAKMDGSDIK